MKYNFKNFYSYLFFIIGCMAIGCYIFCFSMSRDFWLDEAALGINILKKSYFELWLPLDLKQVAPPLLLMISKLFYQLPLGLSAEQSMRLYILFCGILSVPLFFSVAQKLIKNNLIRLIVFLLFCFNSNIIYYTQEFKQYTSDAFWGLFIIWIFLEKDIMKNTLKRLFFYGLLMGCLLFLSHTTIFFVVASLGMLFFEKRTLTLVPFKINWRIFNKFLFLGLGYLIPFSLLLLLDIYNPHHEFMNLWWSQFGAFLRYDFSNLFVVFYAFLDFFFYGGKAAWVSFQVPERIVLYDLVFVLWILIIFIPFIFFKRVGKKILCFSFITTFILIASYLKLYPSADRTLIYYYPVFLLIFGIYADSKIRIVAYFSRLFLIWFLLPVGVNSSYLITSYSHDNLSVVSSSVKKLKSMNDITPVYINEYLLFPIFPLEQQDHGAVFLFYQDLFHYTPNQVVRYGQPRDHEWVSQNCFPYLNQSLKAGEKYVFIWEDTNGATFKNEGYKIPLDCFVRFGSSQSFKKIGKNLYSWTQKQ